MISPAQSAEFVNFSSEKNVAASQRKYCIPGAP